MSAVTATRKSLHYINDEVEYFQHQIEGVRWGAKHHNILIADEMGLGKTLEALTIVAVDFEKEWASRVCVVAPATLKGNWQEELDKFTTFTYHVLDGTPNQRRQQLESFDENGLQFLIINPEQIVAHLEELNALKFDIEIVDEAHIFKNPKAKRTKAWHKFRVPRHILVTGSPMLNHVNELWSLLHRLDPDRFSKYWAFVSRYCVFGGFRDKQIVGVKNEAELHRILTEYMLRRRKADVLDLPEKQIISIPVDLLPEQKKLYNEINDEMMLSLPGADASPMEINNALTKFLRLKQVCGTTAAFEGYADHSSKLDLVVSRIEELIDNGDRVVVWTQFRAVLACLEARLKGQCYSLHGDVPIPKRTKVVRDWSTDRPLPLLAMIQVAGVGLNMTAASKALKVDKLFVPKLNEQCDDRLHRIGTDTTQPVQIYELIARHTIEQRIETILRRKTRVFGVIVDESDFKRKLVRAMMSEDDEA